MATKFKIAGQEDENTVTLSVHIDYDGSFMVKESTKGYVLLEITTEGVVILYSYMADLDWVVSTEKKNGATYLPVKPA